MVMIVAMAMPVRMIVAMGVIVIVGVMMDALRLGGAAGSR